MRGPRRGERWRVVSEHACLLVLVVSGEATKATVALAVPKGAVLRCEGPIVGLAGWEAIGWQLTPEQRVAAARALRRPASGRVMVARAAELVELGKPLDEVVAPADGVAPTPNPDANLTMENRSNAIAMAQ